MSRGVHTGIEMVKDRLAKGVALQVCFVVIIKKGGFMRTKKICTMMYGFIVMSLFISPSAMAASYYLDATNGKDHNDGLSPGRAWKTIRKVNRETFKPGDEIKFKRGEVFNDSFLNVPSSGKKGNPITFKDYGKPDEPLPTLTYSGNSTI